MIHRVYVEKKAGFDIEAQGLLRDLKDSLHISGLESLRILKRYDLEGLAEAEFQTLLPIVFSEPPVDQLYFDPLPLKPGEKLFAVEYLPGQFDQRADSAAQASALLIHQEAPLVRTAAVYLLKGSLSGADLAQIKAYCINPVESRDARLDLPETLQNEELEIADVEILEGFIELSEAGIAELARGMGLAMSAEDLNFCKTYFRDEEGRNPSLTEIRLIDTYWSDHCRHTTFNTDLETITLAPGFQKEALEASLKLYRTLREKLYRERISPEHADYKPETLMDLAVIAMKALKAQGALDNLEESEENNACSIEVQARIDGKTEPWLVMFKNETHNHPTEIEPFGGAATCLGGAIRDPLSGRAYVYQAMRITGSADPRQAFEDTLPGKLPQKKITTVAARGYSSYGNQIGLATGLVSEIYHPRYVAKRMEVGAVLGAAPKSNVRRESPRAGDLILLLGGRTGRDGIGGATGSSKEHTEESLSSCSAEVQKGNPPTERKIQRLFRRPELSRLIKKCNDFGAGGISVAIGELAPGLSINLDEVSKKYEGLDGTELAISESQERMAVVIDPKDLEAFVAYALEENLEAKLVAQVEDSNRLRMSWRGKTLVDVSRSFLDSNGVRQKTKALIESPDPEENPFKKLPFSLKDRSFEELWYENLGRLEVCSQKGLVEQFDSSIGAASLLVPFGGRKQLSPSEAMAALLPVLQGDCETATLMSWGFNVRISEWSPYAGAAWAVSHSLSRLVASGADYTQARLSFQEYFERLGKNASRWGKPLGALLGALEAQMAFQTAAIGGKDSMSGSFKDLDVPPSLISFALAPCEASDIVTSDFKAGDFKGAELPVYLLEIPLQTTGLPDFEAAKKIFSLVSCLRQEKALYAASTLGEGGLAAAISKMCFGNFCAFRFDSSIPLDDQLFLPRYASIVLQVNPRHGPELKAFGAQLLGWVKDAGDEEATISIQNLKIPLAKALEAWSKPLEAVFPQKSHNARSGAQNKKLDLSLDGILQVPGSRRMRKTPLAAKPRVLIPVFPGTNCEYDSARAFEKAGAEVSLTIIRNLDQSQILESLRSVEKALKNSQILMFPGGFSAGDEPDGSGKFIAAFFRNPLLSDAVEALLEKQDGLILGICNGFQALIKLGLLPQGKICELNAQSPTLTFNTMGRHISSLVQTKTAKNSSPWLQGLAAGSIHTLPISHGEGRFVASEEDLARLHAQGQIAFQYVDPEGRVTMEEPYNPNGSSLAIEGITSPCGRILGKMGHSERIGPHLYKNIPGDKNQFLFESGVGYFA